MTSDFLRSMCNKTLIRFGFFGLKLCIQSTKSEADLGCQSVSQSVSQCVTLRTRLHVTELREYK